LHSRQDRSDAKSGTVAATVTTALFEAVRQAGLSATLRQLTPAGRSGAAGGRPPGTTPAAGVRRFLRRGPARRGEQFASRDARTYTGAARAPIA